MDRQLRNIGLIGVLFATLTIVAVVSPEDHRSTTNTVILDVAVVAAAGSLLALVVGSVWFGVVMKDARRWWRSRPRRRWSTRYYPAQAEDVELRESGVSLIVYTRDEKAVRADGVPCLVLALEPRTLGDAEDRAEERLLEHATVECTVKRRQAAWYRGGSDTQVVEIKEVDPVWSRALVRWPDEWFAPAALAPTPGRYVVHWQVRPQDGRVERSTKRFRIVGDAPHVGRLTRAIAAVRGFVRHLRALD